METKKYFWEGVQVNKKTLEKLSERSSRSWNQRPDFFELFRSGGFRDVHPVTLEKLDTE